MSTPPSSPHAAHLWALLCPWFTFLQTLVPVNSTQGDATACVWLAPSTRIFTAGDWLRVFDALYLFAVLQRLDAVVWERSLCAIWPSFAPNWLAESRLSSRKVSLGIEFGVSSVADCKSVQLHFLRASDRRLLWLAEEFIRTCTELMNTVDKETWRRVEATRLLVPTRIRIVSATPQSSIAVISSPPVIDEYDVSLLAAVVALVQLQDEIRNDREANASHTARLLGSGLRIDHVRLDADDLVVSETGLLVLSRLAKTSVSFAIMSPVSWSVPTNMAAQIVPAIQSMLRIDTPTITPGLTALRICTSMPSHVVPALLSAVQWSQSLRSISITIDGNSTKQTPVDRLNNLKWIAYSVFSHQAKHRITRLEISTTGLMTTDVDVMGELLVAEDPFHALFDLTQSQHVTTSKFLLIKPPPELTATILDTFHLESSKTVRAIQRADHWTTVLLPGWGTAWVATAESTTTPAVKVVASTTSSRYQMVRPFSEVALLNVSPDSKDAVLALLAIVGRGGVERLRVTTLSGVVLEYSWCIDLLDACPDLSSLDLQCEYPVSLAAFSDSYESGRCCLQELSVSRISFTDGCHFLNTLCNSTHSLSKTLRKLECGISFQDGQQAKTFLEITLKMLHTNQRLEDLRIRILPSAVRHEDLQSLQASFTAYLNVILNKSSWFRRGPMDRSCKAAFISVMQPGGPLDHKVIGKTSSLPLSLARDESRS